MIIDDKYYEEDDPGDDSQSKPDLYEHHRIVVDKG